MSEPCRLITEEQYRDYLRLKEQLKEANEIISIYRIYDDTECGKATEYCNKWGVE